MILPVVMVIIMVAAGLGWWGVESRKAAQELAVEVQKLRARGEPLTTVELNDSYVAAPGRPDMTAEILTALAVCDSPALKPAAQSLPIVGQGPPVPAPPENWAQLPAAEAYLAKLRPAIDTFHEVARREGTARYPVDLSVGISAQLEHAQQLRGAARALSLQCHVQLHHGRPHEAVESLLAMLALARTLEREPCIISQLVRVAIDGMTLKDMEAVLNSASASDEDLARLQAALRNIQLESSLQRAFAGERAMSYMACVDPLGMNGQGPGMTPAQAQQLSARPPQRVYDAAMILRNSNRIIAAADDGLAPALRESQSVEGELRQLAGSSTQRLVYMMTLLLTPACTKSVEALARSAALRDSADAAMAAELYRRRHGKWPERLEQLVPDFLPAVPIDAFSEQPLLLTSTPRGVKVYSVGPNGADDGGDFTDAGSQPIDVGFALPLRDEPKP